MNLAFLWDLGPLLCLPFICFWRPLLVSSQHRHRTAENFQVAVHRTQHLDAQLAAHQSRFSAGILWRAGG